jgi:hypothetical protein
MVVRQSNVPGKHLACIATFTTLTRLLNSNDGDVVFAIVCDTEDVHPNGVLEFLNEEVRKTSYEFVPEIGLGIEPPVTMMGVEAGRSG